MAARSGLARWNELETVSAHLIQSGAVWKMKGQQGALRRPHHAASPCPCPHYFPGYTQVAGITLPTEHRILPRTPEGQGLPEPRKPDRTNPSEGSALMNTQSLGFAVHSSIASPSAATSSRPPPTPTPWPLPEHAPSNKQPPELPRFRCGPGFA